MAALDLIRDSLRQVEERSFRLASLLEVLDSVGGDSPPSWVSVLQHHVAPLDDAIQALVSNVNMHVIPVLGDMSLNRGMGAVAPMGTKVVDGDSITSRK